jgi:hypothetical protein
MASTYVNDLRLEEIGTGDQSGTWGNTTNLNLELIGQALGYGTQQSFSADADVTTTIADGASDPARAMYFKVTSAGNLTATRTLTIAPNTISRVMFIENATSGSQSIAISQGSGASVTIATGKTAVVYLDGAGATAAVVDAMAGVDPGVTDTLTEVLVAGNTSGGTNIELSTTDKVQFRDTGIYINSSVDGQLDIVADTEIQIAATTVDLNGNLDVSGTALVTGVLTTTAATVFNGGFASNADSTLGTDKKVQFRDSAIYINSSADGQLDLVADTEIQIAATTIDVNGTLAFDSLKGTGATTVTNILDEDNMASDSATAIATQQSIKAYVDSQVGSFDTLAEVLAQGNTTGGTDLAVSAGDDITFTDTSKAIFGAGSDLEIYHDGSNSYIKDQGTGNLNIQTNGVGVVIADTSASDLAVFNAGNGQVSLYNSGSLKLATTATGIDVTGTVTADGLTVSNASGGTVAAFTNTSDADLSINLTSGVSLITPTTGILAFGTSSTERMRIDASGAITTTSSASFGGNVIIPAASILYFDGGGDTFMREPSANIVQVNTAGALAMTIDATQNVIIEGYVYPNSGIYLGGSVAANLLDDYEEGTWTPAYTPTTGTFTTITTVGAGSYTKVGRLVTVFGSVRTSGTLDVTGASGNLKITGLPFACNATAAGGGADLSHQSWNLGTDILNTRMSVAAGASEILMFNNTMNGSSFPSGNITVADMSTSGGSFSNLIAFTASYQV